MQSLKVCSILWVLVLGGLAASAANAQKICVIGVSQDLCDGKALLASPVVTQCTTPQGCQTLGGALRLQGFLKANPVLGCDEAPELNGAKITATGTLHLRQQPPEPQRGSWTGTFTITGPGISSASGNLFATLGVGTHRLACLEKCGTDCERCYNAVFDSVAKAWKIHSEGILDGSITSQQHIRCHIRWSYAGTFTAPGTPTAPGGGPWGFCGSIDGVLECPCS